MSTSNPVTEGMRVGDKVVAAIGTPFRCPKGNPTGIVPVRYTDDTHGLLHFRGATVRRMNEKDLKGNLIRAISKSARMPRIVLVHEKYYVACWLKGEIVHFLLLSP